METGIRDPKIEWLKCSIDAGYFIDTYCYIYNATDREWLPFKLWAAQVDALREMQAHRQLAVLKARQLGLSWLVLCYVLWHMLFHPAATALFFSKRDDEAVELVDFRLKGVYQRLPAWLQTRSVAIDNSHEWRLSNGSAAMGFPTTGGRSYTGSIVVVDEADFVQDLDTLLNAVQPTIDAGGQMIMISTVDKEQPNSPFKRIYTAAKKGATEWGCMFLPWHSRPGRTPEWYEARAAEIMARTGSLDGLHQEYPATDSEALASRTLDKRIPAPWIEACFAELSPIDASGAPTITGLTIYKCPASGTHPYVIGCDPAEGNPNSDDSAATVLDAITGEEVASLAGKFEPSTFAGHIDALGQYYNRAEVMVERNNHGHAVLLALRESRKLPLLLGHDERTGWMSSPLGKALLYSQTADAFRDAARLTPPPKLLHSLETYTQLASIEGATLRAPKGDHDDRADSFALAVAALVARANQKIARAI